MFYGSAGWRGEAEDAGGNELPLESCLLSMYKNVYCVPCTLFYYWSLYTGMHYSTQLAPAISALCTSTKTPWHVNFGAIQRNEVTYCNACTALWWDQLQGRFTLQRMFFLCIYFLFFLQPIHFSGLLNAQKVVQALLLQIMPHCIAYQAVWLQAHCVWGDVKKWMVPKRV